MASTVNEAVKRFCPFTFGGGSGASKCLAGLCMAWRVEATDEMIVAYGALAERFRNATRHDTIPMKR